MGTQEWLLLGVVVLVPLIIAIVVTLWTLEQAIKRNRKNQRGRVSRRVSEPVIETATSDTPSEVDPPADSEPLDAQEEDASRAARTVSRET